MSVRKAIGSRPGDAVAANCRRWVTALMALAVAGALSVAMIGPATTASAATAGWTLPTTPTPGEAPLPATNSAGHAPAANPTVEENGVSCTSSAFCVAVGDYLDSGGVAQRDGLIDTYSGGTWTATVAPEPATNSAGAGPGTDANGHQVAHLESVSCASAGNCVAVGDYEDANGFVYGLIEVLSGGTWTATAAPEPATNGYGTAPGTDTNTKQQGALTSVTCVSATSCLAVGRYKDSDGNTFGLIETLASGAWTPTAAAEPTTDQVGAASGNTAGGAGVATLAAVECQSAVACLAVGKYNDADGNTIGLIEALASGSWSATAAPEPATNSLGTGPGYTSGGAGTASLADVTCAPTSGGVCIAVGRYTDTNAKTYGLVETFASGAWTATAAPEPSTNAAGAGPGSDTTAGFGELASVACPSATSCVAVGAYNDTNGKTYGLIDTYASGSWSASAAPVPATAGTDSDTLANAELVSVACASATNCAATGWYTDATVPGYVYGLGENLASGSWSAATLPEPSNAGTDAGLEEHAMSDAVACTSDGGCLQVGTYQDTAGNTLGLIDEYAPLAPTVHAISPRVGTDGRKVTIAGTDFYPDSTVHFGRVSATSVTYQSSTRLQAVAPAFHGTVPITVTNAGGTSAITSGSEFTYASPVSVGTTGTPVGLTGVLFSWHCVPYADCHARGWLHVVITEVVGRKTVSVRGELAYRKFAIRAGHSSRIQLLLTSFGRQVMSHRNTDKIASASIEIVVPGNVHANEAVHVS